MAERLGEQQVDLRETHASMNAINSQRRFWGVRPALSVSMRGCINHANDVAGVYKKSAEALIGNLREPRNLPVFWRRWVRFGAPVSMSSILIIRR